MRGSKAKTLRRFARDVLLVPPYDERKIRPGRRWGGPAFGTFPYPVSRRVGEHFDVLNMSAEDVAKHIKVEVEK